MQFHKKTSIGSSNFLVKLVIKIISIIILLFLLLLLIDQIKFPSPNKEIKKNIPNENLKIIK